MLYFGNNTGLYETFCEDCSLPDFVGERRQDSPSYRLGLIFICICIFIFKHCYVPSPMTCIENCAKYTEVSPFSLTAHRLPQTHILLKEMNNGKSTNERGAVTGDDNHKGDKTGRPFNNQSYRL